MKSLHLVALVAVVAVFSACSDGNDGPGTCSGKTGVAGTREITITSGGLERTFQLDVPASALTGQPVPLVLVYHGVFSTGPEIQANTEFPAKAAAEGFITAAGDGIGKSWNAGVCCQPAQGENVDDVGFTRDMVATIESEYCVDPQRVYATGFSNGAAMVFRLFCEAADLFAAYAPVGGSLALFPCEPSQPRPMQITNMISDPVVNYQLGVFSFAEQLKHNACSEARESAQLAPTASCEIAPECADDATTEFCSVSDLGHRWPGGTLNPDGPFLATDATWDFLSDFAS
jgi:polyhydroxybutyrate depolymerase